MPNASLASSIADNSTQASEEIRSLAVKALAVAAVSWTTILLASTMEGRAKAPI